MNEQLQPLTRSADRRGVALQVLVLDGPLTVLGGLSANPSEPGSDAVRQATAGTRHVRNDTSLGGGNERYLRRMTRRVPARALPRPHRCKEITPKTTESHWSGGQREP